MSAWGQLHAAVSIGDRRLAKNLIEVRSSYSGKFIVEEGSVKSGQFILSFVQAVKHNLTIFAQGREGQRRTKPNPRGLYGDTPLHLAAMIGKES